MEWSRVKEALIQVAPGLASALGTPLTGAVVKSIIAVLGLQNPTEPQVTQAIENATPEQHQALLQLDYRYRTRIAELEMERVLESLRIDQTDRHSARQREIATHDLFTPRLLAGVVTLGFFCTLGWLLAFGVGDNGRDVVLLLVGTLASAFSTLLAYYFGSSAGSNRKTEAILHQQRSRDEDFKLSPVP